MYRLLGLQLTTNPIALVSIGRGRFAGVNPKGLGKATRPPPKTQETQLDIFLRSRHTQARSFHLKPLRKEAFGRSPGASEDFSTECRLMPLAQVYRAATAHFDAKAA